MSRYLPNVDINTRSCYRKLDFLAKISIFTMQFVPIFAIVTVAQLVTHDLSRASCLLIECALALSWRVRWSSLIQCAALGIYYHALAMGSARRPPDGMHAANGYRRAGCSCSYDGFSMTESECYSHMAMHERERGGVIATIITKQNMT